MNNTPSLFSELHVEVLTTGRHFRLIKEFTYTPTEKDKVIVPIDFKTDFASIPWLATIFIPKLGKYTQPSVIHDYLCREADTWQDRSNGDTVFRKAMKAVGVGLIRRWAMYIAVWIAGVIAWTLAKVLKIRGRVGKQWAEDQALKKATQTP